jgi:hypothetical protein
MCDKHKRIADDDKIFVVEPSEAERQTIGQYFRSLPGDKLYEAMYERLDEELYAYQLEDSELSVILDEIKNRLSPPQQGRVPNLKSAHEDLLKSVVRFLDISRDKLMNGEYNKNFSMSFGTLRDKISDIEGKLVSHLSIKGMFK